MKLKIIFILLIANLFSYGQSPVIVELFTSQGCSSCPSADKLVSKLSAESKINNSPLIVLSFHVDYWNRLGWVDPYSRSQFTSRQRAYTNSFDLSSTYTPQAVVNGQEEFVGSNENKMRNAIRSKMSSTYKSKISSAKAIKSPDGKIKISYSIDQTLSQEKVLVALVYNKVQTKIGKGENSGVLLEETNVVSQLEEGNSTGASLTLETGFDIKNSHIVVFIQNQKTLAIEDGIEIQIN